jgi:uncharacterized protein YbdZ (MbtH family)
MTWLYLQSDHGEFSLWTVGFYTPQGKWEPESDHKTAEEAATRVHYLNGGRSECRQCPHVVGDIYERDCAFPDCMT